MQDLPRRRLWIVLLGTGFEGSLIGLAALLGWLLGKSPLEKHFRLDARDAAWGVAACLPLLLGAAALMRWPVGPLARIKQFTEEVLVPLFAPCSWIDLALISLLAGVGEELLFRGVLQVALARRLGALPGLLIAGALFGLLHPVTRTYVVLAALIGVYLGWLFERSGNLLLVMVAHALYDFVVLAWLVRRRAP
jgi:membrane protease YdiL (CAAX protease family)